MDWFKHKKGKEITYRKTSGRNWSCKKRWSPRNKWGNNRPPAASLSSSSLFLLRWTHCHFHSSSLSSLFLYLSLSKHGTFFGFNFPLYITHPPSCHFRTCRARLFHSIIIYIYMCVCVAAAAQKEWSGIASIHVCRKYIRVQMYEYGAEDGMSWNLDRLYSL